MLTISSLYINYFVFSFFFFSSICYQIRCKGELVKLLCRRKSERGLEIRNEKTTFLLFLVFISLYSVCFSTRGEV